MKIYLCIFYFYEPELQVAYMDSNVVYKIEEILVFLRF